MKKRFLAVVLCACVLAGTAASAAGSASQSSAVVSRNYLEGTYLRELVSLFSAQVTSARESTAAAALEKLDLIGQGFLDRLSSLNPSSPGWLTSGSFTQQTGEGGTLITLSTGSGVIWTAGTAYLSGSLIDVTDGRELSSGALTVGHRYVASAESTIAVTSMTGQWSVEGQWKTAADAVELPEILFEDVPPDSPDYEAVCYVVRHGLFVGTSDTKFSPNLTINRGMMATVLHRFAGEPATTYAAVFSDVAQGQWYAPGVIWAAESQVVIGMGDGTYRPTEDLTYQQVAIMLYNYANWAGIDTSARADLTQFTGGDAVSGWAKEQMSWAVAAGIMVTGDSGELTPKVPASRVHVAVMMQRFDLLVNS